MTRMSLRSRVLLAQSPEEQAALRQEIAALPAQQAEPTGSPLIFAGQPSTASPAAPVNPAGGSAPGAPPPSIPSQLTVNGDVRVR